MRFPTVLPGAISLVLALSSLTCAEAQQGEQFRAMNGPAEPFHLIDNIYYVGASDVTSFLITTPEGHILLDGGFEETAPRIAANIRALGFRLEDVRILLNSHGHTDHAGGLAALKKVTGARLFASAEDAPLLERGGRGDFQWGDRLAYPSVSVDSLIGDGDEVRLGSVTMRSHLTPGHTRGCTTWSMRVRDGAEQRDVLFLCSMSAPGYRLVDNAAYPSIVQDYERTFALIRELPCEVFLAAHGAFFSLADKAQRLRAGERPNPFVDPAGCRRYIERAEQSFRTQLRDQERDAESASK